MKLRNKKTGEIKVLPDGFFCGDSLKKICEEWEDTPEEPKEHWCITMYGGITRIQDDKEPIDDLIEIGNYFKSKEDVYDAIDKLKAWKRLKDKGFRFTGFNRASVDYDVNSHYGISQDLDLLFGGEE